MKCASLSEVLSYKNEEVIFRFSEDYGLSLEDSAEIFSETLRWLWLSAHQMKTHAEAETEIVSVPLLSEVFIVDLMWHNFILFTQDYANFCHRYFETFIHHIPQSRQDKESWKAQLLKDPVAARSEREIYIREACELIYDTLGPETLSKWMEDFPERFGHLKSKTH